MLNRMSIQYASDKISGPLVMVEVGVYIADNAMNVLENLNLNKLYLVDPYISYGGVDQVDFPNPIDKAKQIAFDRTSRHGNKVRHIYKKFEDCTRDDFDGLPIDFIYIDSDHSADAFRVDFNKAKLIVRNGGILGGHDALFPGVNSILKSEIPGHQILSNRNGQGEDWLLV